MAERAHPDDPGFQDRWTLTWRKGVIPWITRVKSPYRHALLWRYEAAAKLCAGKDVLDIPCGMGWGTSLLRGCHTVTGLDVSKEAIEEARRRYGKGARFEIGDMATLPFPAATFDLIVCLEGIEHVPPAVGELFLRECSRVLRSGGEILVSSPHCVDADHSGNPFHFKEYSGDELKALIEPYFDVVTEEARRVDDLLMTLVHARKKHMIVGKT